MFVLISLWQPTPPTLSLAKFTDERENKLCEGELRCVFIFSTSHYTHFFYIKFIFFCMNFFKYFFLFGKFHFSMCVVAVKAVFRIGREETIACLLLWKIEKNLYFFFSAPWGQHNIILTHFPRKKSFFSSPIWKLFFPHNIFFRLQYIKSPDCGNAKNQDTAAERREINNFSFLCVKWKSKRTEGDSGQWTYRENTVFVTFKTFSSELLKINFLIV